MSNDRSLAALLALDAVKDSGVILRVPEDEKSYIQQLADARNVTVSDFIRQAIYYYTWATSEVELKVHTVNSTPEFIDLINTAPYDIFLANYLITDDTFNSDGIRTNVYRHSIHFGPLVFETLTGQLDWAVLRSGQIVRVYSGMKPTTPPPGISIWTGLGSGGTIWNNSIDRVSIHRIARKDSEDIIAGVPLRKLQGLKTINERKLLPKTFGEDLVKK